MHTKEEIQAELEKVDALLSAPVLDMATQTSLESYQNALGWVLGIYEESPSQREA